MTDVSTNIKTNNSRTIDLIGFIMVVIPLFSTIILWYWFYFITALNITNLYILVIAAVTILLTSIIATIDSHRLGVKVVISDKHEIYGGMFFQLLIFILLWPYSYPVYLFRRKNFGSRNLLYPILFSLLIFVFSTGYLYYTIEMKNEEENSLYRRKMYQGITR